MDPTLGENQNDQSQKKQSGGGINWGINAANNLMRGGFRSPFGKFGSRAILQVGSKVTLFLFTTPAGWIAIGITAVVIFTIVIVVSFGGAPSSETVTPTPAP